MLFGTETAELEILHLIQNIFGCSFLDFVMPRLTVLGNGGVIWIFTAIALLCTKKYRRKGMILSAALILGLVIGNLLLKNLIARPRPCWIEPQHLFLIANPQDFSFPSGHTWSSFAATFVLWQTKRSFGILSLILAILIAFSRLYLFVHFPTDIIGGIALGYAMYRLSLWIFSGNLFGGK